MAELKSYIVFGLARGIKLFLSLRVGVTRGGIPDLESDREHAQRLRYAQDQFGEQRSLVQNRHGDAQPEERLAESSVARRDNDAVTYNGVVIPAKSLRPCGASFREDEYYLASAKREAETLVKNLGLTAESSLLDVGCGPGRLAIGILESVGEIEKYRGADVKEAFIRWGQRHITPKHPNFQFIRIDVENPRYNPSGSEVGNGFAFPFSEEEFDVITLYSVFTHMLADDIRAYLKDFRRILRPAGQIFLTAFIEDGVPDVTENPEGYLGQKWEGALHCVRYNREFFETLLDENGLRLDGFDRIGGEGERPEQGQCGLYVSKKPARFPA